MQSENINAIKKVLHVEEHLLSVNIILSPCTQYAAHQHGGYSPIAQVD